MEHDVRPPVSSDGARGRAWLAALLLQRQSRLMPRFALALARLRALPRGQRQRLKRRAAATLAGAALVLAIGAASFGPPGAGVAHAATITVANGEIAVNDNGVCSLIEAIINAEDGALTHDDCAAGTAGADTIELPAAGSFTFSAAYVYDKGDNGLPTIDTTITINGNGSTLDLGGAAVGIRLALVSSTGDLTLNSATVSYGDMDDSNHGGGVFRVDGGTLAITDSTLSGNATSAYGGAIYAYDGATVTVSASTLSGNFSARRGGAIYGWDSAVTLTNSHVTGNTAARSGAGVQVNRGSLKIEGGSVSDNGWEPGKIGVTGYVEYGGGVFADSATVEISGATIDGNYGGGGGGGVRLQDVSGALITGTTITNNTAHSGGGVKWGAFGDSGAYPVTGVIRDSIIDGNTAYSSGGGIQMTAYSTLSVERTTISDNTASYTDPTYGNIYGRGGGVSTFFSTLTITQSAIHGNTAGENGGGLYSNNYDGIGSTMVTNTTISGNSAGQKGGGVFLAAEPKVTFNNVTISDNESLDGGGLTAYNVPAYAGTGTVTLNRTIVSGNRSRGYGAEILTVSATITANNFNLFGHSGISNGVAFNGFTPGANDITATSDGTQPTALASILAPLADNGGPTTPATMTHGLVTGSPALDGAPDAACTAAPVDGVDQRDVARNQDGDGAPGSGNECDIGAFEGAITPVGLCIAPANELTTLLGIGMGSPKKAANLAKIVVPNRANVVSLYGQLVGKDAGRPKFVRFLYPNGTYVQVDAMTALSPREGGIFWYGTALDTAAHIRGRWFMQKGKGKVPRAFLLYATHSVPDTYFNSYSLFDDGNTNQVGPGDPWATYQTFTLSIDPPTGPADVTVQVALVDNDKDTRPITVSATAGTASDSDTANGPTNGNTLSLITLTLEDVPAGTDEVVIELQSGVLGDSAAIVGAAVNYACEP